MGEERNGSVAGQPKNSRRRKAMMLFAVAALVTVGSGLFYWWYRQTHIATDDAYVEGRIHPVAARIQGTVVEGLVVDNQPGKQGGPLLRSAPGPRPPRRGGGGARGGGKGGRPRGQGPPPGGPPGPGGVPGPARPGPACRRC